MPDLSKYTPEQWNQTADLLDNAGEHERANNARLWAADAKQREDEATAAEAKRKQDEYQAGWSPSGIAGGIAHGMAKDPLQTLAAGAGIVALPFVGGELAAGAGLLSGGAAIADTITSAGHKLGAMLTGEPEEPTPGLMSAEGAQNVGFAALPFLKGVGGMVKTGVTAAELAIPAYMGYERSAAAQQNLQQTGALPNATFGQGALQSMVGPNMPDIGVQGGSIAPWLMDAQMAAHGMKGAVNTPLATQMARGAGLDPMALRQGAESLPGVAGKGLSWLLSNNPTEALQNTSLAGREVLANRGEFGLVPSNLQDTQKFGEAMGGIVPGLTGTPDPNIESLPNGPKSKGDETPFALGDYRPGTPTETGVPIATVLARGPEFLNEAKARGLPIKDQIGNTLFTADQLKTMSIDDMTKEILGHELGHARAKTSGLANWTDDLVSNEQGTRYKETSFDDIAAKRTEMNAKFQGMLDSETEASFTGPQEPSGLKETPIFPLGEIVKEPVPRVRPNTSTMPQWIRPAKGQELPGEGSPEDRMARGASIYQALQESSDPETIRQAQKDFGDFPESAQKQIEDDYKNNPPQRAYMATGGEDAPKEPDLLQYIWDKTQDAARFVKRGFLGVSGQVDTQIQDALADTISGHKTVDTLPAEYAKVWNPEDGREIIRKQSTADLEDTLNSSIVHKTMGQALVEKTLAEFNVRDHQAYLKNNPDSVLHKRYADLIRQWTPGMSADEFKKTVGDAGLTERDHKILEDMGGFNEKERQIAEEISRRTGKNFDNIRTQLRGYAIQMLPADLLDRSQLPEDSRILNGVYKAIADPRAIVDDGILSKYGTFITKAREVLFSGKDSAVEQIKRAIIGKRLLGQEDPLSADDGHMLARTYVLDFAKRRLGIEGAKTIDSMVRDKSDTANMERVLPSLGEAQAQDASELIEKQVQRFGNYTTNADRYAWNEYNLIGKALDDVDAKQVGFKDLADMKFHYELSQGDPERFHELLARDASKGQVIDPDVFKSLDMRVMEDGSKQLVFRTRQLPDQVYRNAVEDHKANVQNTHPEMTGKQGWLSRAYDYLYGGDTRYEQNPENAASFGILRRIYQSLLTNPKYLAMVTSDPFTRLAAHMNKDEYWNHGLPVMKDYLMRTGGELNAADKEAMRMFPHSDPYTVGGIGAPEGQNIIERAVKGTAAEDAMAALSRGWQKMTGWVDTRHSQNTHMVFLGLLESELRKQGLGGDHEFAVNQIDELRKDPSKAWKLDNAVNKAAALTNRIQGTRIGVGGHSPMRSMIESRFGKNSNIVTAYNLSRTFMSYHLSMLTNIATQLENNLRNRPDLLTTGEYAKRLSPLWMTALATGALFGAGKQINHYMNPDTKEETAWDLLLTSAENFNLPSVMPLRWGEDVGKMVKSPSLKGLVNVVKPAVGPLGMLTSIQRQITPFVRGSKGQ